jgi:hypothetical protein
MVQPCSSWSETVPALRTFQRRVVTAHISNRHVDLAPVLAGLAKHFGLRGVRIDAKRDEGRELSASQWMLFSASDRSLSAPEIQHASTPVAAHATVPLWTDNFHNLLQVMKW